MFYFLLPTAVFSWTDCRGADESHEVQFPVNHKVDLHVLSLKGRKRCGFGQQFTLRSVPLRLCGNLVGI